MQRIKLKFDMRVRYGSKEHFWHLMLGYLLPSINFYFQNLRKYTDKKSQKILLEFEDCGPLMNPVIEELTGLLKIPIEINTQTTERINSFEDSVYVPRWDVSLRDGYIFLLHQNSLDSDMPLKKKYLLKRLILKLQVNSNLASVKKDLLLTRNLILESLGFLNNVQPAYLLLDRSDLHNFYDIDGKAESKGYGQSRRAFLNIEEKNKELQDNNVDISIYRPGSHSILHQIKTFNQCKGVVAIRGAELANLIWLNEGSNVVVINPMGKPAIHLYNYVSLLGLKLVERRSEATYPSLLDYDIKQLLERW